MILQLTEFWGLAEDNDLKEDKCLMFWFFFS